MTSVGVFTFITVDWDSAQAWFYAAYLASLFGVGAYGVRRSWFSSGSERADRAAAAAA